jgi:hypothetical protein
MEPNLMRHPLPGATHPALPGPFRSDPSPEGVKLTPPVSNLVAAQVQALLESSPAFYELPKARQQQMRADLEKIAGYSAALIQDEWSTSERLGQTPVLRTQYREPAPAAAAEASRPASRAPVATLAKKGPAADEFSPRAANQVARITGETLNAIAFPTFVADLIKGTFNAIVDASIKQMEAYATLLANVAKTVDQFMADNITDNNARDHLANTYPGHFKVAVSDEGAKIEVRDGADELPKPDFKSQFGLSEDVELDGDAAEEKLVPAARRSLAKNRHSLLSTMVLMGINRIVVTSGRINAKMGFRINTKDTGTASSASQFDFKHHNEVHGGFLFGGASQETSIAYVSSSKKDSSDEIDVQASLTGEVDLKFKSDYFPMERFAKPEMLALIQGNTPNPTANTPNTGTGGGEAKQAPAQAGGGHA